MASEPRLTSRGRDHGEAFATGRTEHIFLAAFVAYSALAILVTFPLVLYLSSRLPHDLGDPLLVTSLLWWNAHAMPLTEQWWNGFGFFPSAGMMAFSENFLGAALIASPLQWLGASPVTAYNVTLLTSFPLCAIAAHALAWTLTRRHDAAIVCGLAYGFNPYRVAHLEHLELLLAFGMPAALAALHLYTDTRRARWLVAFAAALVVQALCTSYYALFFTVFVGLWLCWFMQPRAWRDLLAIVAAGGAAVLLVSPIFVGYARIHQSHGLSRGLSDEVRALSADVSSFVTASPLSAIWGWTAAMNDGVRQLFPGLTIATLGIVGVVLLHRSRPVGRDRLVPVTRTLWALSATCAAVVLITALTGPWRLEWSWLTVSVTALYKPFSLSVVFALAALALGPTVRGAFRRRSVLGFYLLATGALFLCSLGPEPALFGEQVLYQPPYAWLMRLPYFGDTVRAPERFGMLGMLALSAAGALAFARLPVPTGRRTAMWLVVIAGIGAEGLVRGLPLPMVPADGYTIPPGDRPAAVMELPLGDVFRDSAALYRATLHGLPAINGYNGHEPVYYGVLKSALTDRDPSALEALASLGPLLVATDNRVDHAAPWAHFLSNHPGIARLRDDGDWTLFRLPSNPAPDRCSGNAVPVSAVFDAERQLDLATLTDQNPATRWITAHPQRAGDALTLDLGRVTRPCSLAVSMGADADYYPRALSVETSLDNDAWETGFTGTMGGPALLAALENPLDARFSVPLQGAAARFIRLSIEQSQPRDPWAVADVVVQGR